MINNFKAGCTNFHNKGNNFIIEKTNSTLITENIFLGVFCLFSFIFFILVLLTEEIKYLALIPLCIGLFFLRIFLWKFRGKEIITINKNYLTIKKTGSFLMFIKKFELRKIKNLTSLRIESNIFKNRGLGMEFEQMMSFHLELFGMNSNGISFKYDNISIAILENTSEVEKEKIIEEINLRLNIKP
ncbi:hypothetical protein [Flavobacterium bernardetii]|uniref:PH domain-containing protein n=1 Tax=Flavobacterium bernardetii TaxID=2813823 RepID=A0ABR7IVT8_9FLAO|nr:hypothetical protein [Flavobacterium bernardetii]MBC5833843.1 hypothetical protein [Flavobacterium bernardetii]